jgi:hypothetical protein
MDLSGEVAQMFCTFCSQVLIPGVNSAVQLRPHINPKAFISDEINTALISAASHTSSVSDSASDGMQTPKSLRNKPPSVPGSAAASSSSMKAAKQVAALTAHKPGTANELVFWCSTCNRSATVVSATPRAWRTQQRIKRLRAHQAASAKKKKLEQQLRSSELKSTPLLQQPSMFGSALFSPSTTLTPKTSGSASVLTLSSAISSSKPMSAARTSAGESAPCQQTPDSTSVPTSSTVPSKPLSLLEQRAKDLKAAKKKQSNASSIPAHAASSSPSALSTHTSSSSDSANSTNVIVAGPASSSTPSTSFSFNQFASKPFNSSFSFAATASSVSSLQQSQSKKPKLTK